MTGGTASAYSTNAIPDYIADLNSTSLIIKFPSGNLNKYIQKTISPAKTITGYTEISFYMWSRNQSGWEFHTTTDFAYKINFGGSDYYIPTYTGFNRITIYTTTATVDKIRITALHDEEDYICISEMNAVLEEYPLDIYTALKESIEAEIAETYPDGILVGTVTNLASASTITLSADDYVDRFAVLKIKDLTNSETHQVWEFDESTVKFTSLYSGETMVNAFTAGNVYLQLPVEYMAMEKEMILPGIVIYGLNAERIWRGSALEDITDTFTSAGASTRREGAIEKFSVNIHCYARHAQIMSFLTKSVRHVINKQKLWINGSYFEMAYEGTVSEVDPAQVYDLVPQMIYQVSIEIKEEMYARVSAVPVSETNLYVYSEGVGTL
jgi:hypothetical protein